jgi:hypothetical protein
VVHVLCELMALPRDQAKELQVRRKQLKKK